MIEFGIWHVNMLEFVASGLNMFSSYVVVYSKHMILMCWCDLCDFLPPSFNDCQCLVIMLTLTYVMTCRWAVRNYNGQKLDSYA